jgi:hypothetical protein
MPRNPKRHEDDQRSYEGGHDVSQRDRHSVQPGGKPKHSKQQATNESSDKNPPPDLPEFFLSGAGLAVANIPHSDCTVFTPGAARQPSLIAFGERFKALESVQRLCVVFGNRQNKAVLAF